MIWEKFCVALAALGLAAVPVQALTVQEVTVSPSKTVWISVTGFYTGLAYAGINQLLVDGVAMNGFCVDPFHFSLPISSGYHYAPLVGAPKPPGSMSVAQASEIAAVWAVAYSPSMSAPQAAGLQIAIWEIVGGSRFSVVGSDYGASVLRVNAASYLGSGADLVALTGPGQDYVVLNLSRAVATVPEGGSGFALLGFAAGAILLWQRRAGSAFSRAS